MLRQSRTDGLAACRGFASAACRLFVESSWPVAILLLLLTLGFRLPQLKATLILDEEETLKQHIDQPIRVIVTTFGEARNHPLYSVLAHACRSVHRVYWSCRVPALVAGVATVALLWLTLRGEVGELPAVWAAASLAVSAPHAAYSVFARGYTLLTLGGVASNWLLLVAMRRGRLGDWFGYSAVIVLTVYSHLWGLFLLAGHSVFVLAQHLGSKFGQSETPRSYAMHAFRPFAITAIVSLVAIALLYAAMIPHIFGMLRQERTSSFGPELAAAAGWLLDLGHADATLAAWGFVAIAAVASFASGRRWLRPTVLLPGVLIVVSVVLVGVFQPANFYARFLIFLLPNFLAVAAFAADCFPLLARPDAPVTAWCGRPNRVAAVLAWLGAGMLALSFVVTALGTIVDRDSPNFPYVLAPRLAWFAAASLVAARLCGGVPGRRAAWYWLVFTVACGYAALDLLVSLKGRNVWTFVTMFAGAGLIVWTAGKLRAKLAADRPQPQSGEEPCLERLR